jgi:hypothetical protein
MELFIVGKVKLFLTAARLAYRLQLFCCIRNMDQQISVPLSLLKISKDLFMSLSYLWIRNPMWHLHAHAERYIITTDGAIKKNHSFQYAIYNLRRLYSEYIKALKHRWDQTG